MGGRSGGGVEGRGRRAAAFGGVCGRGGGGWRSAGGAGVAAICANQTAGAHGSAKVCASEGDAAAGGREGRRAGAQGRRWKRGGWMRTFFSRGGLRWWCCR